MVSLGLGLDLFRDIFAHTSVVILVKVALTEFAQVPCGCLVTTQLPHIKMSPTSKAKQPLSMDCKYQSFVTRVLKKDLNANLE